MKNGCICADDYPVFIIVGCYLDQVIIFSLKEGINAFIDQVDRVILVKGVL